MSRFLVLTYVSALLWDKNILWNATDIITVSLVKNDDGSICIDSVKDFINNFVINLSNLTNYNVILVDPFISNATVRITCGDTLNLSKNATYGKADTLARALNPNYDVFVYTMNIMKILSEPNINDKNRYLSYINYLAAREILHVFGIIDDTFSKTSSLCRTDYDSQSVESWDRQSYYYDQNIKFTQITQSPLSISDIKYLPLLNNCIGVISPIIVIPSSLPSPSTSSQWSNKKLKAPLCWTRPTWIYVLYIFVF